MLPRVSRKWNPALGKMERVWVFACVTITPVLLVIDLANGHL